MPRTRESAAGPSRTISRSSTSVSLDESEALAARLEIAAKFTVVVDLSVEQELMTAIGRRHRLGAVGGRIDDGQAPVDEDRPAVGSRPAPAAVRATMRQGSIQPCSHGGRLLDRTIRSHHAGEPAHG